MFKKKLLLMTFALTLFGAKIFASGIQVINTTVSTNDDRQTATVKFSLTWDHSWRLEGPPSTSNPGNWDAAWVFIKYRTLPGDNWHHAYISTIAADHTMPGNAQFRVGQSIANVHGANIQVGVGTFIYRAQTGSGTVMFQDCELKWNFTQNGLTGGEQVEVCVLATEMVYIPLGGFWLGDYTSQGRFRNNTSQTTNSTAHIAEMAYNVTGAAIPAAFSNAHMHTNQTGTGYINPINTTKTYLASWGWSGQTPGPPNPDDAGASHRQNVFNGTNAVGDGFSTNYPRGYNAFYCMKYEITQGEYLQFLNKNVVSVKNASTYWYDGGETSTGRYYIIKRENTGTQNVPAEYDFINPAAAYLPMPYLSTNDIMAWLIWAGLRPMTELEFEKICRGPVAIHTTPTLRPQYAWGTVDIYPAAGFTNQGGANEAPSNTTGNAAVATAGGTAIGSGTNSALVGPMRAGGFATPVSSREKAGATFYGVMEMSGNLWERAVSAGSAAGRAFQGWGVAGHGNGETGAGQNPVLPAGGGWPSATGQGLGFRGGSYLDHQDRARISDRMFINHNPGTARHPSFGGRGVRSEL